MPRFKGKVSFVTKPDKTLHARATYVNKKGERKEKWSKVTTTRTVAKDAVISKVEKAMEQDEQDITTFAQLADYYVEHHAIPPVYIHDEKVKGMEGYKSVRSAVKALKEFFGDRSLDKMTRGSVQEYRVHIFEKRVKRVKGTVTTYEQRSLSSINDHLRRLRSLLLVAETEKWLDEAPSFKGLISDAAEASRDEIPTEAEFVRILQATEQGPRLKHVKPLALMVADTGARPVELWRLKWPDLDLENGFVTLTSYKGRRVLRRTIPLSDRLVVELKKLPRLNEFVFGGIKSIKHAWHTIQKLANTNVDFYALRHFFATRIDMMPISDNQREKLMGHSSRAMFGRYAKLTESTLDDVRDMLNNMPLIDSTTTTPN